MGVFQSSSLTAYALLLQLFWFQLERAGKMSTWDADPIVLSCARGDAKRAARLLERLPRGGRYRDLADYDKRSPAHLAAAHGRTEILRLLDEYGLALDGVSYQRSADVVQCCPEDFVSYVRRDAQDVAQRPDKAVRGCGRDAHVR